MQFNMRGKDSIVYGFDDDGVYALVLSDGLIAFTQTQNPHFFPHYILRCHID